MDIKVEGTLPVAITLLVGQKTVKTKQVVMRQLTVGEYLAQQATLTEGAYLAPAELAAMTKLVDEDAVEHQLTYEALINSSKSNYDKLSLLKAQLEAKEAAAS